MPFLRFKGMDKDKVKVMSPVIIEQFARIADVAEEKVKIELLVVEQITNSPSSVEILMFEREQEKHDAIAAMMNDILEEHDIRQAHIFFVILSPTLYYKEGVPLKRGQVELVR
ncbi:hypothetical protein BRE01_40110 [Brevibacillus reuszeri]|uniref:4-oxalocrotonate tautomerase domain-containing protein n=1 Tax=Brevibacillus reuszeri TaxID=54915 RepID=A0A0K9YVI2_9BACL|nr:DUF1904 family protein [Brevibacillus reuszeri]KNB72662.1 hypothetical protein ADS79_12495 [Brevibacillus reuszeri]MED1860641.1 DUF1904 family protein [Brevibacillus reuszeri]GED70309.1 hypothetical protein BRE01_40110 [Brevibacillus reuszeri]